MSAIFQSLASNDVSRNHMWNKSIKLFLTYLRDHSNILLIKQLFNIYIEWYESLDFKLLFECNSQWLIYYIKYEWIIINLLSRPNVCHCLQFRRCNWLLCAAVNIILCSWIIEFTYWLCYFKYNITFMIHWVSIWTLLFLNIILRLWIIKIWYWLCYF